MRWCVVASLRFEAGARALAHIRAHGLAASDITMVPGAAGGPKGLGLAKLDEWLFADWLPQSFAQPRAPIELIGASIGAWRFAAVARGAPQGVFSVEATRTSLQAFAAAYSEQRYPKKVDAALVSAYARELLRNLFADHVTTILHNPYYRLNILAVRGKGILRTEARGRTHAGFALASLANLFARGNLKHFLDRVWFAPAPGNRPESRVDTGLQPFFGARGAPPFDDFHTDYQVLNAENFPDALIASGSIPIVLSGVAHIAGGKAGTYWDGGIIDYHLHLPYATRAGIAFYPHFSPHIVPGWLDKMLPWRRARAGATGWLDNVIVVSPTREYLDRLPFKKLPDRGDFKRFANDYAARMKYWRMAMAESGRLRDECAEAITSGRISALVTPLR